MEILNSAILWLQGAITAPIVTSIAIGLEILFRLIPTAKPKSILLAASSVCKKIGEIFSGAAALIDKVVPQQLK